MSRLYEFWGSGIWAGFPWAVFWLLMALTEVTQKPVDRLVWEVKAASRNVRTLRQDGCTAGLGRDRPLQPSGAQGSVSSSGGCFPESECPKGPSAASEASDNQPRKSQSPTWSARQITRPAQHPGERGPIAPPRGRGSKGLVAP